MPTALIGLGSNLGDRNAQLAQAIKQLEATPGIAEVRASRFCVTKPVGGPANQEHYLNAAAVLETSLSPEALLAQLHQIEFSLGRRRQLRWEARPIDLDLLLYDEVVLKTPTLEIPHPSMAFRRFVLEPALEIAPQMLHPKIGWTIEQLFANLCTKPLYVAVAGAEQLAVDQLIDCVAMETGWPLLNLPDLSSGAMLSALAGPERRESIEFLIETAQRLDQKLRAAVDSQNSISGCWIEGVLASCNLVPPDVFAAAWRQIEDGMLRPQLLVVYHSKSVEAELAPRNTETQGGGELENFAHDANALWLARAKRQGIGPVLWLDSSNPIAAQTELAAAMQAMGGNE